MDCIVHGVAKSQTGLSDFHLHFILCLLLYRQILYQWTTGEALEFLLPFRSTVPESSVCTSSKMAHIPKHGERRTRPTGVITLGLIIRVSLGGFMLMYGKTRRRQWQPTPVLLPGRSHGRRGLVGCSPWGREESDTTEWLHFHFSLSCTGEGNGNPLHILAWRIPGTGEPGGLPSVESHRVGHDWSDLAAAAASLGFPGSSAGKEFTCNAGDSGSIPGSGRSAAEEVGYPFQYS